VTSWGFVKIKGSISLIVWLVYVCSSAMEVELLLACVGGCKEGFIYIGGESIDCWLPMLTPAGVESTTTAVYTTYLVVSLSA
jgi:hypothetical protein